MASSRAIPITVVLSVLIAAGACAVAFTMRPQNTPLDQSPLMAAGCRPGRCAVLQSVPVAGGTAELSANRGGTLGTLRLPGDQRFDVEITDRGARLARGSLICADGDEPACLVAGDYPDGRIADVFVAHRGVWSKADMEIASRGGYLGLYDSVPQSKGLEVIAVQQRCADGATDVCAQPAYFAQVFDASGKPLGCTRAVSAKSSLPGAPDVSPEPENVHTCT